MPDFLFRINEDQTKGKVYAINKNTGKMRWIPTMTHLNIQVAAGFVAAKNGTADVKDVSWAWVIRLLEGLGQTNDQAGQTVSASGYYA